MANLECKVTSCAHYQKGCCSLQGIHVGAEGDETCCESYRKQQGTTPSNSVNTCACSATAVQCDARQCCYNSSGSCAAGSVCIDTCKSDGTKCDTFCTQ